LTSLFGELKRRNVFRVAVAYIVSSWLILQVADVVLGNIEAPSWVFSVFLLALGLGLLPVLFFSWAYEITPEGLKKESEVDRSQSITSSTGRKLNLITIIMLVAVVAFVMVERTMFSAPDVEPVAEAPAEPAPTEVVVTDANDQSIAVLAFDDLSESGDQAFFAEGLSEELLNVLAQVPSLKVAGRTSSFAFKDKDTDLREIGEILNVAHILEGSVRKAGNRIRVTAQLIKASDGFHLFSETYDRDVDDIFAVQDELAALISTALKAELTGEDAVPNVTPTELAAYDLYLVARQRIRSRNPELMYEALDMLDEALAIDPDYAPAIAQRALATYLLSDSPGAYGEIPQAQAEAEAKRLLERALGIDPNLAEAHAVLGLIETEQAGSTNEKAIKDLRRALEINPNLESAKLWLANAVTSNDEAVALYEEVILRDPMYTPAFNNLIQYYGGTTSYDEADALIARVERVTGPDHAIRQARGTLAFMKGTLADAARNLQYSYDANPNATIVKMWRGYTLLQLGELDSVIENDREELVLIAHRELGDYETADRLIEETDFRLGDQQRRIRHTADYLGALGRYDEMIDIVDEVYGGAEGIIESLPMQNAWGSEYMGPLAYIYLQADRQEEFGIITGHLRKVLDDASAAGQENWYHWYSRAQYAALTGDHDEAIEHLERALDTGFVSVLFIEPLFDLLREDARFLDIEARALARANEEREKLGLGPYRPAMASN
jgi:TolB-like protein